MRHRIEELNAESEKFQRDLQAAGKMTPELKLRAATGKAKARALLAEMKAQKDERAKFVREQRAAQKAEMAARKAEVEKTRAALKDDPGLRG